MSDTSQGPGWWQASDQKWYPPESTPGTSPSPPPAADAPAPAASATPAAASTTAKQVKPAEIVIMASGALAFVFSFIPLFTSPFGSASVNSWSSSLREFALLVLLALAAAIVYAVRTFASVQLPTRLLSFSLPQIVVTIGVYGALICFAGLIDDHGGANIGIGLFLMILVSAGLIVGGILDLNDAGEL